MADGRWQGDAITLCHPPSAICHLILSAPVFVEVTKLDDLPLGRVKTAEVGGRRIALYHTADGFFATDNTCPHRGGPLAEGDLVKNEITCPWHLWSFDIISGTCPGNPEISVATHEVRIEGDAVLVKVPS